MKLVTGFRGFVLRGDVIDLAVAVVTGTASTAVVTSTVPGLVNPLIAIDPLIAAVGGGPDPEDTRVVPLREGVRLLTGIRDLLAERGDGPRPGTAAPGSGS